MLDDEKVLTTMTTWTIEVSVSNVVQPVGFVESLESNKETILSGNTVKESADFKN